MGRRALGEDVDDRFGLAGEVRGLRGERAGGALNGGREEVLRAQQVGEGEPAHAHSDAVEELPAREEVVREVGRDAAAGVVRVSQLVGGIRGVGHGGEGANG